jgi:hypothetical protein
VIVFVAAPFTQLLREGDGVVPGSYRYWLEALIAAIRADGHTVVSAHEREQWGLELDGAADALRADVDAILSCDVLVAELGDPPSPGVQMELGVALAAGKRILVLTHRGADLPYLSTGLEDVAGAKVLVYDDPADVVHAVPAALRTMDGLGSDNGATGSSTPTGAARRSRGVRRAD